LDNDIDNEDEEEEVPMMNGERGDISVEVERKRSFLLRSVVDDVERVAEAGKG